jgi:hypothetical protein
MGDSINERLRIAAEGLILSDAQKHILAHRLTRKLRTREVRTITVSELLAMIEAAMCDMAPGIEMHVVSEDSYRDNRIVKRA